MSTVRLLLGLLLPLGRRCDFAAQRRRRVAALFVGRLCQRAARKLARPFLAAAAATRPATLHDGRAQRDDASQHGWHRLVTAAAAAAALALAAAAAAAPRPLLRGA